MDTQEVFKVHSILHLIYHRNKNQHQRAKWWKWLAILKRTALDMGSRDPVSAEPYRQHLAFTLIPRCYQYVQKRQRRGGTILPKGYAKQVRAFSTVVADNQFSTLGVALLAALARLTRATGADRMLNTRPAPKMKEVTASIPVEDRGERVNRHSSNTVAATRGIDESSSKKHQQHPFKQERSGTKSTKKVTKRKKNAIDDLFSGLL